VQTQAGLAAGRVPVSRALPQHACNRISVSAAAEQGVTHSNMKSRGHRTQPTRTATHTHAHARAHTHTRAHMHAHAAVHAAAHTTSSRPLHARTYAHTQPPALLLGKPFQPLRLSAAAAAAAGNTHALPGCAPTCLAGAAARRGSSPLWCHCRPAARQRRTQLRPSAARSQLCVRPNGCEPVERLRAPSCGPAPPASCWRQSPPTPGAAHARACAGRHVTR
jgi:hypothetical protein